MIAETCRDCGNPKNHVWILDRNWNRTRKFPICHRDLPDNSEIVEEPDALTFPEPDAMDIRADVEQVLADLDVELVDADLCVDCGLYPPQPGYDSGRCIACAAFPGRQPGICSACKEPITKAREPNKYAWCKPCMRQRRRERSQRNTANRR